jgi:23S rRNA pseudouridine955/2504/2580 synthase
MDFISFTAGPDDDGRRLERVLKALLPDESLSVVFKAIRKGLIKVNGKKIHTGTRVSQGATITIANFLIPDKSRTEKKQFERSFQPAVTYETLFKNDFIQIINKPYDISVQGKNSLTPLIIAEWDKIKKTDSLSFRPGPLHRLDRKTSGIVAFSQNLEGARWFSKALTEHMFKKTYITLLEGKLYEKAQWKDEILIEKQSLKHNFYTVAINANSNRYAHGGKEAETEIAPLAYGRYHGKIVTFAECIIKTGRKHQIRAQAAQHGFPLLGDTAYGGEKIDEPQDIYLHAYELAIPVDNPLELPALIRAPILTNFRKMLNRILIKWDGQLII